ncbi:hypothetical protein PoB_007126600 [Plakobranchus ocellatus]|uniref:Uncharacterized protein n=1 Tax=Plakobranchus ocellatus TaxID=259542 RepID=A0AAV4DLL6_9GAST|nr:hypothetical protein PoB_007126600 [Plakobranchus ocellatus]
MISGFRAFARPGRRWRGPNPQHVSPCRSQGGFGRRGEGLEGYKSLLMEREGSNSEPFTLEVLNPALYAFTFFHFLKLKNLLWGPQAISTYHLPIRTITVLITRQQTLIESPPCLKFLKPKRPGAPVAAKTRNQAGNSISPKTSNYLLTGEF